jgi:hypothetical protein
MFKNCLGKLQLAPNPRSSIQFIALSMRRERPCKLSATLSQFGKRIPARGIDTNTIGEVG